MAGRAVMKSKALWKSILRLNFKNSLKYDGVSWRNRQRFKMER